MPRGDHTGPLGQGPRTGRAAGYCAGYDMPGYMNPLLGRGFWGRGCGRGGGRGWRNRFYATGLTGWQRAWFGGGWLRDEPYPVAYGVPLPTREQQVSMLQADLRCLEQTAEQLRQRIEELSTAESERAST